MPEEKKTQFDPDFSHKSETNQQAAKERDLKWDSRKGAYVDAEGSLVRDKFGQSY
jgi:hypothetical protein